MELTGWHLWLKRTGGRQLREVVLAEWDPIGVADVSPDEYDSYLGLIAARLRRGDSVEEIAALLSSLAEDQMGMPGPERVRRAAAALHAWYAQAMEAAGDDPVP